MCNIQNKRTSSYNLSIKLIQTRWWWVLEETRNITGDLFIIARNRVPFSCFMPVKLGWSGVSNINRSLNIEFGNDGKVV